MTAFATRLLSIHTGKTMSSIIAAKYTRRKLLNGQFTNFSQFTVVTVTYCKALCGIGENILMSSELSHIDFRDPKCIIENLQVRSLKDNNNILLLLVV